MLRLKAILFPVFPLLNRELAWRRVCRDCSLHHPLAWPDGTLRERGKTAEFRAFRAYRLVSRAGISVLSRRLAGFRFGVSAAAKKYSKLHWHRTLAPARAEQFFRWVATRRMQSGPRPVVRLQDAAITLTFGLLRAGAPSQISELG